MLRKIKKTMTNKQPKGLQTKKIAYRLFKDWKSRKEVIKGGSYE